jgi:hypothetical protein
VEWRTTSINSLPKARRRDGPRHYKSTPDMATHAQIIHSKYTPNIYRHVSGRGRKWGEIGLLVLGLGETDIQIHGRY